MRVRQVAVLAPQCVEVHVDSGSCESTEPVEQGREATAALLVERDCQVIAAVENVADQTGQYRRWPDFDERSRSAGVHRFDHVDEPDGVGQLARQLGTHRIDVVVWVGRSGLVGMNRHDGRRECDVIEEHREGIARSADHG